MITIKVFLNRLETDYAKDFARATDYFLRHNVTVKFIFSDVNIKTSKIKTGYVPVGYGNTRLLVLNAEDLVPASDADVTMFAFNGKEFAPDIPTSSCVTAKNGKPYICLQTHINDPVNLDYVTICHEMMHALVRIETARGHGINDVMDSYYLNDQPENPESNFGQQWNILRPYLQSPTMPQDGTVTIKRSPSDSRETTGVLEAHKDGATFTCKTLELPWKNNQKNISCIPKGVYTVSYVFWPKKLRWAYTIQNVPGRTGIYIHEGNYYFNYEGCIGLGNAFADLNGDGEPDITSTKPTLASFENFMKRKTFNLIIV